jgi:hypothetical protein
VSQIRVGDGGGEKQSATGHCNRVPKNPTPRRPPLRIS